MSTRTRLLFDIAKLLAQKKTGNPVLQSHLPSTIFFLLLLATLKRKSGKTTIKDLFLSIFSQHEEGAAVRV